MSERIRTVPEKAATPSETVVATEPAGAPLEGAPMAAFPAFTFNPLALYKGVIRRFFKVYRHVIGLLIGANVAYVRALPPYRKKGLRSFFPRLSAFLLRPFVHRHLVTLPFPRQLRRRLEMLGPTYVKLGQIMAIREDLLPKVVTTELQNLFDRLPSIPFEQVQAIIERDLLGRLEDLFDWVDPTPLGSASIAQAHLARTHAGEKVVVKVIKPGIRDVIQSDLKLLQIVGHFLQWIIPRYQPQQIIEEFSAYTIREVDYSYEADNAEIFAANFQDLPNVVFPRIYRELSSADVLTMSFLDGFQPGSEKTRSLTDEERARVIDLGAASIIRMLYQDGFFHADLHAGNLLILPGDPLRIGFLDLGMVGRFEDATRRRMLYYFHALVKGDVEGATKYLTDMATPGAGGDMQGFRRAVADMARRFLMHSKSGDYSIAQLILESISLGGKFRVFFPVEMTLMVKALVTFEGVGRMLDPHLDITDVSQKHIARIFLEQFNPGLLSRTLLRSAPEMVDLAIQLPRLLSSGYRFLDQTFDGKPQPNPLAGLRTGIVAGSCIVGGVLAVVFSGPPILWGPLFGLALLLYLFGK